MLPYYSPNLSIWKFVFALATLNTTQKIKKYFSTLLGKKYILLTYSCRAALYLSYKAIGHNGKVITTPLTCDSALSPIVLAGNDIYYVDININTLNIDANKLDDLSVTDEFIAVQAIHFGGLPCDMKSIHKFSTTHKLILVEDCAQSFGAYFENKHVGTWGDIACFSLIKNLYGIGGGLLATNNHEIYLRAKQIQNEFPKAPLKLLLFRCLRNIIETNRGNFIFEALYQQLMLLRNKANKNHRQNFDVDLRKPHVLMFKIAYTQIKNIHQLIQKRIKKGFQILDLLQNKKLTQNYKEIDLTNRYKPSFVKLYLRNSHFDSKNDIRRLNQMGVEAKHLAHKYNSFFQPSIEHNNQLKSKSLDQCVIYKKVINQIISLPLFEKMNSKQIYKLINVINELYQGKQKK